MTYPAMQTYWLESTDRIGLGLRRYSSADREGFTCDAGYHSALVKVGQAPAVFREEHGRKTLAMREATPRDDPRWPTNCSCGYEFTDEDHWQGEWNDGHKCWVRHGDPRASNVTVDKNGDTCSAGAGSILAGDYHGFLQAGVLTAG